MTASSPPPSTSNDGGSIVDVVVSAAPPPAGEYYTIDLRIPTSEDMEDIGGLLSANTGGGDVVLLDGDLGAGKTCLSRGFVRVRTGRPNERVTSPTYLLSNTYDVDGGGCRIYHMDLYRLSPGGSERDLSSLDLENAFVNGICLVEWPSRLGIKPVDRLDITLTMDSATAGDDGDDDGASRPRLMHLVPHGDRWLERLKFLESNGYFDDLLF
jgi:tRNA threonylcarbamoyladenosine biosynthesis protein TsaE